VLDPITIAVSAGPEGFEKRSVECLRCGHSEENIIAVDPLLSEAIGWLNGELRPPKDTRH
jgi:hypothetical protein